MFTFNGISSSGLLVERNVTQAILPPLSPCLLTVPGRDGVYDFGPVVGAREIAVDVVIKGTSQADLRSKARQIAEWLYQEDLKPLVFSDEPDKTYYARVAGGTDLDQIVELGQGTITFLCPDPYAHGATVTQAISSGTMITYSGSAKTFPVFTVTFSQTVTSFEIANDKGKKVKVSYNFQVGDVLVIDHDRSLVKVGELRIMPYVDLSSEFYPLVKGSYTFTLTPSTVASVSLQYKEKWL